MFLKASTQPPLGTIVRIDLELPSATVIELQGTIVQHVTDPQRGAGVDLKLDPLPTKSVWMIESALAAENKVRATTGGDMTGTPSAATASALSDGEEVAAAELDLIRALEAEAESLRKLNPFLVLGVGYETTDSDVRAAFGELTKRYHPDRFARYQSQKLRQIAAEIFILIRDAYRRLADDKGRQQVLGTLGPKIPTRAQTQPRGSGPPAAAIPPRAQPPQPPAVVPPRAATSPVARVAVAPAPPRPGNDFPTAQNPHDAPTNQSGKPAELANTELAKTDDLGIPVERPRERSGGIRTAATTPARGLPAVTDKYTSPATPVLVQSDKASGPVKKPAPVADGDTTALEALIDEGKLDEAINGYRVIAKKAPGDKAARAGIELVEGMRALVARDRMEAAQRFEAALELDPSNERAARELADMRRQATNERKGLLSRLMGKKEPPP